VHAHDWQAALAIVYLHYAGGARPRTVMTIHNLAYQGQFAADLMPRLELPPQSYGVDGVEYYGAISFLKGGLQFADRITTVSPTYADEICTPEFGMGLDGLLRARASVLSGIINGVDVEAWNPANDPHLTAAFDAERPGARTLNRTALQERMGLRLDAHALLIGVVSRLTWQKGLDMLLATLAPLMGRSIQLALLGAGEPDLEQEFRDLAARWPGSAACVIGYDEQLAHMIQAGCDALAVPSRFEPCGLTQMYALRYGAAPIVARVGGLADTVIDASEMALASGVATGLQFAPATTERLAGAMRRALALFRDKAAWRMLQKNGMATDVSWRRPARRYMALYRNLLTQ
jgi:starch synthase